MADDVAGVIKALNLGSANVAGNDFGNRVARTVAASHPELTRSAILLAAGGKVQPAPPAAKALGFNPASTDADIVAVFPYLVLAVLF
jgi:pimeloyl-ACP methyl ester carboxylesterase